MGSFCRGSIIIPEFYCTCTVPKIWRNHHKGLLPILRLDYGPSSVEIVFAPPVEVMEISRRELRV